jgi:hypothetical protein
LNSKIGNIMLAFGHVMDEPEDLLQMVLGMTSPALFRELFAEAPQVPADSLGKWFDQKTATFGGRDVIATVKEIVGNCDRFDFQSVGKDLPPVDLPELRPFLEAMLIQNRRRPRRGDDRSLSFKTPEAWLSEVGVRTSYEGLVFDRSVRGKDAVMRVVGVGHKVIEQALNQALDVTACVTSVINKVLHQPLIIARLSDRVTGRDVPVRSIILAAEKSETTGEWVILRDWEAVRRLNEVVGNVNALRTATKPLEEQSAVKSSVDAAMSLMTTQIPKLEVNFRVPFLEPIAVIWPGAESSSAKCDGSESGSGSTDDFLD